MTVVIRAEQEPTAIVHAPELKALTTAEARALLEPRLPKGVKLERVLSEVYFAIKRDPKLAECTPESLVESTAKALSTGLVIGEKVYLIPFNVKVKDKRAPNGERWEMRAQAIKDYKGDVELVKAAGGARHIDAHVWYENEPFDYELGSHPFVKHKPLSPAKRGKPAGAYAVATTSAMVPPTIKVMYIDEIEATRQRYSKSWKSGELSTIIHWYGPKTAIKQLIKLLPSTPGLQKLQRELEDEIVTDAEIEDAPAMSGEKGDTPPLTAAGSPVSEASSPSSPAADLEGVSRSEADVIDDAYHFKLPGKPGVDWNKQAGKEIGAFRVPHLEKIRDWCVKQLAESDMDEDDAAADPVVIALLRNVRIVLEDRKLHPEKEPAPKTAAPPADLEGQLKASVEATRPAAEKKKPAGSGGPVNMPKPGTIESAFSVPQQKANTAPSSAPTPTFGQLVKQITKLLESADRTEDEKADIRQRMEVATSIADLQALVADLSFPV